MDIPTQKELEKAYEDNLEMFATAGWKTYVENATSYREFIMNAAHDHAVTNDMWQYARGEMSQLKSIIGLEDFIKMSWENQEQQENDFVDLV